MEFYAAESVTYLTAGMQDWFENQDVDIESAIVKVYTYLISFKYLYLLLEYEILDIH